MGEKGESAFNVPIIVLNMVTKGSGPSHKRKVALVNVHLWYGMFGATREKQLIKIKAHLNQMKKEKKVDYIMMAGDFNDVSGRLLRNEQKTFINHGDIWSLQHVDTCANGYFSLRLDHVISSPELVSTHMWQPYENEGTGFGALYGSVGAYSRYWAGAYNKLVQSSSHIDPKFTVGNHWFRGCVDRKKIIAKYGSDHLPMTISFHVDLKGAEKNAGKSFLQDTICVYEIYIVCFVILLLLAAAIYGIYLWCCRKDEKLDVDAGFQPANQEGNYPVYQAQAAVQDGSQA